METSSRSESRMFNLTKKHKLVFLILIEVLLIYLIYILAKVPGSSGYEPSIYAMYPNTFWLIYFIIYLSSLCALIYSIFIKHDRLSFYSGLFNLLILNLIILLLPFFRGYLTVDFGDSSAHLSYIKDILSFGHLGELRSPTANPYPMTHIQSATIMLITQIKIETIGQITGPLYYFIYALFVYLLGRELYKDNRKSILLLLLILIPILRGHHYYQSQMFFLLIPMLLYAFAKDMKSKSSSFRYIIVILIIFLPIMHAASSILLMMLLTIICIAWYVADAKNFTLRSYKTTPLIFLVIWLFWTTSLKTHFTGWVQHYVNWIANLSEQYSYYGYYTSGLAEAELSVPGTITLYIKIFGPTHLLFGMALVFSIYGVYNWIKKGGMKLNTVLSLIFLVYIVMYLGSFFFTVTLLGARISIYTLLIAILVNASFLFELVNALKTKIKKIISLILIVTLLFSTTYIATFGLYSSPFTKSPPNHCTYMSLNGMHWFFETRNKDLSLEGLNLYPQHRYTNFLWGSQKTSLEPGLRATAHTMIIPHHFNYDNESLLAKTIKKDCYLVVDKRSELITTKIYPEYEYKWHFTPDDYKQLEYDKSLDKIYHNGEMKIFYVNYDILSR